MVTDSLRRPATKSHDHDDPPTLRSSLVPERATRAAQFGRPPDVEARIERLLIDLSNDDLAMALLDLAQLHRALSCNFLAPNQHASDGGHLADEPNAIRLVRQGGR
jgi:hypothetical protein